VTEIYTVDGRYSIL